MSEDAPIWTARELYKGSDQTYSWAVMLHAHMAQGYCISAPTYFICARPVDTGAPREQIIDPNYEFPLQHCNAWFVYAAAGDALHSLWTVMPHDLPFVAFYRLHTEGMRVYDTKRIRRLSNHGRRSTKTTTGAKGTRAKGTYCQPYGRRHNAVESPI